MQTDLVLNCLKHHAGDKNYTFRDRHPPGQQEDKRRASEFATPYPLDFLGKREDGIGPQQHCSGKSMCARHSFGIAIQSSVGWQPHSLDDAMIQ